MALEIQQEIAEAGWPVGRRLGHESQLISQYGVGRAVFREAIRLLEHLGIASVRMGPTGGLVVTAPDPSSAIEATALLLEFNDISAQAVHELRLVLELGCIDLLMELPPSEADLDELSSTTPSEREAPTDPDACHRLHQSIGEDGRESCPGNVPLSTQLLVAPSRGCAGAPSDVLWHTRVVRAHRAVISAIGRTICAGSDQMQRQLEALAVWFDGSVSLNHSTFISSPVECPAASPIELPRRLPDWHPDLSMAQWQATELV